MAHYSSKAKILIIDDDEEDFIITSDFIRRIPGSEYSIDWCSHFEEALDHICEQKYDLYITDYRLGIYSGMDLLREALERKCDTPIILLTGKGNIAVDTEAMNLGAVDYLIKSELTVEKMERCIRYNLERMRYLRALLANEKKYRRAFENSKDMLFLADSGLDFKDVNVAATALLGYSTAELLNMNLYSVLDQNLQVEALKNELGREKAVSDWELIFKTKSGESRVCTLTVAEELEDGEVPIIQGIVHDITILRKEEKVTLQSEKLAATARLVRTLAHEVRNPLNNILLSVEQLQNEVELGENSEMYLDIIQRNSQRISALITELLNTSRPTEVISEERVLQEIVKEVIDASEDRIVLKNLKLKTELPEETIFMLADGEKLKLALLNIVINAIEAVAENVGRLEISLRQKSKAVVLSIQDNGIGISEENLNHLFEPYFTQKRNGLGLGLAFTLNILQAHKASIEVTSKLGEGTKFEISFPLLNN
ncbi:MAG: ATP-binding protein [Chitinophagaceae bacterium]